MKRNTYTPDNLPLRTTYASGRWIENVYNAKREVVSVITSDGDNSSSTKDEVGRTLSEVNSAASVQYSYADSGIATNEVWLVNGEERTIVRCLDSVGRLSFNNEMFFTYADDGNIQTLSNDLAKVEYHYTDDRLDSGYSITLSNSRTFSRTIIHDDYRRGLLTSISSPANGVNIDGFTYVYDALNRPISRNADSFAYNVRSEVIGATVSGVASVYGYDEIGNSSLFEANSLNQYSQFQYDLDGNMLSDGNLSFAYDSNNRLKTVSSNGVVLVTNFYDAKSRRVKKVTANATTIFFYDDWNLVEERITYANGTSSVIKYYWGKDLSGTLQGVGGVGGLLYQTIDGVIYLPSCDNNGNILKYVDANGNVVASYSYNAFGALIAESGTLADVFRHRFSSKYFDVETGLYYYGYRFYHPNLMRWLNRDPIEEDGGLNLYGFCENNGIENVDILGQQVYKSITFKRLHAQKINALKSFFISDFPDGDYYGHWWVEFDGESYGWWPSKPVGLAETIKGIPGEVNGISNFSGSEKRDPHHGDSANESFHPRRRDTGKMKYGSAKGKRCECTTEDDAKQCLRAFAASYSGNWSYPRNSCHTFQMKSMSDCCLSK